MPDEIKKLSQRHPDIIHVRYLNKSTNNNDQGKDDKD